MFGIKHNLDQFAELVRKNQGRWVQKITFKKEKTHANLQ